VKDFIDRWKGALALILVGALFVTAVAITGQLQSDTTTQKFDHDLRRGLVGLCQDRINPILSVQRAQLKRDITQSETFDYTKLFPTFPPQQLKALIQTQVDQDKQLLKGLEPVSCQKVFPKSG
jgi:hypothetical protein